MELNPKNGFTFLFFPMILLSGGNYGPVVIVERSRQLSQIRKSIK